MKKKGRGLSWQEKRQIMLRIFHNTKTVYSFQEIEKLSIKAGIPFPSVREILKSLQDDSLIQSEKIGIGVFFWSFPSKAFQIFKQGVQSTQIQINTFKTENTQLQQKIQQAQSGREDTPERDEKLQLIEQLQGEKKELQHEIEKYIRFDPQRVELLKKQNNEKKEKINFWTDNLEQFKKHVKKQMPGTSNQDIERQYGIPADMEYVD